MEFVWPIRVYYEDTDAGGVVYHANYLHYMERTRTEWLRSLGVEQDSLLAEGLAFVVRRMSLDFLKPARFNQQLNVRLSLVKARGASVVVDQTVSDAEHTYVTSQVLIACVDLKTSSPHPIPTNILEEIKRVS